MKSAGRGITTLTCLNCDTPTLPVNFGYPWTGLFNRPARVVQVCGACRRSFAESSAKDVAGWLASNLDPEVRPDFEMMWDRRVARGSKGSA